MGLPEALMNALVVAIVGPRVTFKVYVPGATVAASTISAESVCRRVASTELAAGVSTTGLPDFGERLMPAIGRVKLKRSIPVGGVSNKVIDTVALLEGQLVVQPPPCGPLQDASSSTKKNGNSESRRFEFMRAPTWELGASPPAAWDDLESPTGNCKPSGAPRS